MLNIFSQIYDTLFPPHEVVSRIKLEKREDFARHFLSHRFANCVALADYSDPLIKAAITANKFHNDKHAALLLSVLLERWLETASDTPMVFVPIPLSSARKRTRGYNQVTRVLENMNTKIEICELLVRNKDTKPQTTLKREQRLQNIEDAFAFKPAKIDLTNKHIIIVDDVVTTGTTIRAAHDALVIHIKEAQKITCLALAH